MKLVIVSDLHGQPKTLKYLQNIIEKEKPSAILFAGDLTDRDDTEFIDTVFKIINASKIEAFIIWGNSDERMVQKEIEQSKYSSHLKLRPLGKFKVYGISEIEDPVLPDTSALSGSILLTHRPPSITILNQKFSASPKFHISGHVHSRAGLKKYPSTTHIQVPTLQDGRYAVFYPEEERAQFLSI